MTNTPCQTTAALEKQPRTFLPWSPKTAPKFSSNLTPETPCETRFSSVKTATHSQPKPSRYSQTTFTPSGLYPTRTPITRDAGVLSNADSHKRTWNQADSSKKYANQNKNAENAASGNADFGSMKSKTISSLNATPITSTSTPSNTDSHAARANTHTPRSTNSSNAVFTQTTGVVLSIHPPFPIPSRLASRVRRAHRFMGDGCGARGAPYKLFLRPSSIGMVVWR
jgi:hypothetical protein